MTSFRLPGRAAALCTAFLAIGASAAVSSASAASGFVDGQGQTLGSPSNSFVINSFFDEGRLFYRASDGRTFEGTITCVNVVGKEATIVADDPTTGLRNRTFVQDNGATGDKARNTLFNPAALSPASRARASACIAPPSAQLNSTAPLPAGSRIRVQEYQSPASAQRKSTKTKKKSKKRSKKV